MLLWADSTAGDAIPIADIGRFDWVARPAANRKLRLVAGGFGIQLAPLLFGPAKAP